MKVTRKDTDKMNFPKEWNFLERFLWMTDQGYGERYSYLVSYEIYETI